MVKLSDGPGDPHTAIHEIRKTIKRIRALLKMIRDETGYSQYFRENRFYRDLARRMAPVRDRYVLLQSVRSLEAHNPGLFDKLEVKPIQDQLKARVETEMSIFKGRVGGFERLTDDLKQARGRLDHFIQLRNGFDSIRKGMKRVYRKGLRSQGRLEDETSMAELHEYRKCCRYLQFQVEMIHPIYPRLLKAYATSIDHHTEQLGTIRDLQRLECILHQSSGSLSPNSLSKLQKVIEAQCSDTMAGLFGKSRLIFPESPAAFMKRIRSYWNAHFEFT
jgi:CHAD domain-containing protein